MLRILGFILFFAIFLSLFFLLNYAVLARFATLFGLHRGWWVAGIAAFLALSFLAGNLLASRVPGGQYFYVGAATWVGMVFILACILIVTGLVNLVAPLPPQALGILSLSIGAVVVLVAFGAGNTLVVKEIALSSEKIAQPVRIVHLTDMHLGAVRGEGSVAQIVERTGKLKPDVVVITGDLFDGPGKYDPDLLKAFDTLEVPVLFVYGNHERYAGSDVVDPVVANTKIRTLRNDHTTVGNITFLGIDDTEDAASVARTRETLPVTQNYTVLLYHRPTPWRHVQNIDLQLSGHTHAGQIFPFTFLVMLRERPVAGVHRDGGKVLYVSPGTGTWGPPMRLGTVNRITVIDLLPA